MDEEKVRKNINLTQKQNEAVRKIAFKDRVSESEVIRRAVDDYIKKKS